MKRKFVPTDASFVLKLALIVMVQFLFGCHSMDPQLQSQLRIIEVRRKEEMITLKILNPAVVDYELRHFDLVLALSRANFRDPNGYYWKPQTRLPDPRVDSRRAAIKAKSTTEIDITEYIDKSSPFVLVNGELINKPHVPLRSLEFWGISTLIEPSRIILLRGKLINEPLD